MQKNVRKYEKLVGVAPAKTVEDFVGELNEKEANVRKQLVAAGVIVAEDVLDIKEV